jgi:hypothetical protein
MDSYFKRHSAGMQLLLQMVLLNYQITVLNLPGPDQEI